MAAQTENVTWDRLWVELDIVFRSMPQVARIAEKVVNLVRSGFINAEVRHGQRKPSAVDVMGVEVDHHQDDVGQILGCLGVADELFVIDGMKAQTPVALERRVFPADPVHPADDVPQAVASINIPGFDLVLFRIQVLFTAEFFDLIFAEFKGRTVNAVACSQSSSQDKAGHERRPPAHL
jgi:hypothetical protein